MGKVPYRSNHIFILKLVQHTRALERFKEERKQEKITVVDELRIEEDVFVSIYVTFLFYVLDKFQ